MVETENVKLENHGSWLADSETTERKKIDQVIVPKGIPALASIISIFIIFSIKMNFMKSAVKILIQWVVYCVRNVNQSRDIKDFTFSHAKIAFENRTF